MKLFVIGANGRTGTETLDLARTRGHQVTAFVRSPEKLSLAVTRRAGAAGWLTVVRGDALRSESIAAAVVNIPVGSETFAGGSDAFLFRVQQQSGSQVLRSQLAEIYHHDITFQSL